jgi:hypothetical protein
MSRKRATFSFAATLVACALSFQASAERLRFEGSFNVATFTCDSRVYECLPDQWLDFVAEPITPIPFSFTIDVTQVAEQGVVFRSDTWVAPSLVPKSLISGVLSASAAAGLPPFTQATFDALIEREYFVFRSTVGSRFSDGSLQWSAAVANGWRGLVPPAPTNPGDEIDELGFTELVAVNLQWPGAGTNGPASFADLIGLFDYYLNTQRSVDLHAEFGHTRGDPRGASVDAPFGRMGGSFRLTSIQCRAPSAASNLLAGLGAALRGSH